jgi:dTDP-4-amino-4,6-dideoxygalactose transaminase
MLIPFNKPYLPYITILNLIRSALGGTISGNGSFTKKCHAFFEKRFGFKKVLLTTSCTDALEMSAILCDIEPGDEVIMPSFTFMSTANAFLLRGAKVVFADTLQDIPNIDPGEIEKLVTPKTKAVVVVHYSGISCEMDRILAICKKSNLMLVEDAAHAIDSYYNGKPLGSLGDFGAFSFHETKNIISGEGGLLIVNNEVMKKRAEIIWEKGTNRAAFFRGEVDKYGWVDIGSSFLPSDAVGGILDVQLNRFDRIQNRRKQVWQNYHQLLQALEEKGWIKRPFVPGYATVNGNMYYILTASGEERDRLIAFLKEHGVSAVFHYLPLHSSPYFKDKHDGRELPNTQRFSDCIVRLPFYNSLKHGQQKFIVKKMEEFYGI